MACIDEGKECDVDSNGSKRSMQRPSTFEKSNVRSTGPDTGATRDSPPMFERAIEIRNDDSQVKMPRGSTPQVVRDLKCD